MLHIAGNYYLDADAYNLILKEKRVAEAGARTKPENVGKETYRELGYYKDIRGVVDGIIKHAAKRELTKDEKTAFTEFVKAMTHLSDEIFAKVEFAEKMIKIGSKNLDGEDGRA